jgi:hypothetical protein
MILDKFVEVTIINHNINHYKKLGYNVKCKNKIIVKPKELSSGSHYRLNCACDECENKTNVKYQDYMIVFNKNGKYICKECNDKKFLKLLKENRKKSLNKKYNVDNVFQLEFVKDKMKKTFIEKYGVAHFRQNDEIKEIEKNKRIKSGKQIPDEKLSEFELYKKAVRNYTRKYTKELYKNWNGLDFYDNEMILEYKKLHFNNDLYPHIDHKISIKNGFINNIDPSIIGNIINLCITKRINNLSKGSLYLIPKKNDK